jgi:beta-lactamase superfamily II metal-dependent hydrolase
VAPPIRNSQAVEPLITSQYGALTVVFIDVGQADAALIVCDGEAAMI